MIKATLARMFERSTLISGTIALTLVFTVCYCSVKGIEPPAYLTMALSAVIGWFFGSKANDNALSTYKVITADAREFVTNDPSDPRSSPRAQ